MNKLNKKIKSLNEAVKVLLFEPYGTIDVATRKVQEELDRMLGEHSFQIKVLKHDLREISCIISAENFRINYSVESFLDFSKADDEQETNCLFG